MTSRSGRESVRTGMIDTAIRWFAGPLTLGLALLAGCAGGDGLSPSPEAPVESALPVDSAATTPTDSLASVPIDSTLVSSGDSVDPGLATLTGGTAPGIVFGTFALKGYQLSSVHNGSV